MKESKVVYPVFIKPDGKDYLVYVPDLGIHTEGKNEYDAIAMARDAISLMVMDEQDHGEDVPAPSDSASAIKKAKEAADELFDFSDGVLTFVDADIEAYRKKYENRYVKKNCTVPYWMSQEADALGVNYSRVLQEGLANIIGKRQNTAG
ncbi:MAG: type II toxin-antitoxin system HicB family antitoxin [Eubacterium sp.]